MRKFPRHFKGQFSIGNVQVRILPGQPGSPALRVIAPDTGRKARRWRAFAIRCRSLDSQIRKVRGQFGESLRTLPRIFPFSGDWRRRQGSITTAAEAGSAVLRTDKLSSTCLSGRISAGPKIHPSPLIAERVRKPLFLRFQGMPTYG
jgi:hypothetical protein